MPPIEQEFAAHIDRFDHAVLRQSFNDNDEFMLIDDFLPASVLDEFIGLLPNLSARVHRNFIPKHKKGGSISRHVLDQLAPAFGALYRSPALMNFINAITGETLKFCPSNDAHTYALYYYTEPGDHIGYHYDTSYYRGKRYTLLLGLIDSSGCQLDYQLHTRNKNTPTVHAATQLTPGRLALFNGDKLYHRITPLAENERRIALTFEYVTNTEMHPLRRFVSSMKDSIAYFGFKQVFSRPENH